MGKESDRSFYPSQQGAVVAKKRFGLGNMISPRSKKLRIEQVANPRKFLKKNSEEYANSKLYTMGEESASLQFIQSFKSIRSLGVVKGEPQGQKSAKVAQKAVEENSILKPKFSKGNTSARISTQKNVRYTRKMRRKKPVGT
jgi:hypothetical protein